MSWRAPALPRARVVLLVGMPMSLALGLTSVAWVEQGRPGLSLGGTGVAILLATLPILSLVLSLPLLRGWGLVQPEATTGKAWTWACVVGLPTLFYALGYALRGWALDALFGWPGEPWEAVIALAGPPPAALVMMAMAERESNFHQDMARQKALANQHIVRLFAAREALLEAGRREAQEVVVSLKERAAIRLKEAIASLEAQRALALEGMAADPDALQALFGELGALAEDEFRRLSHRLHPSVVQVGLVAALRSLLQGHKGLEQVPLRLEPQAEGLLAALRHWPEDRTLALFRVVEAALEKAQGPAPGHMPALRLILEAEGRLQLRLEGCLLDWESERNPLDLARVGIDSRVALAGGTWSLEPQASGATTLVVAWPIHPSSSS